MNKLFPSAVLLAFVASFLLVGSSAVRAFQGETPEVNGTAGHICSGVIQPPLEIDLDISPAQSMNGAGGTAGLVLTVTPLREPVRVTWELTVPAPLSLLSGNEEGIEQVKMGEKVSRSMTVSVPDGKRYYLYARAILETPQGDLYTRAVSKYIDLGAPDIAHPSFVRTDPVRGAVVSYRGVVLQGGEK